MVISHVFKLDTRAQQHDKQCRRSRKHRCTFLGYEPFDFLFLILRNVVISAFTVVPGKTIFFDAPADIRLSQAALNDILVDQKRSSLKLSYLSPLNPGESDDDDDEEDLEDEDKKYTINIANFIPGTVRVLPLLLPLVQKSSLFFFHHIYILNFLPSLTPFRQMFVLCV